MDDAPTTIEDRPRRLRLLSYNIQVGLHTRGFRHMVTGAWRHAVPTVGQLDNLDRIAELISEYDFVAIQEADAGSIRSWRLNQMEYLAERAGFNHCGYTVTRNLRPFARHCLGYLSRVAPLTTESHSLPSQIPGRAAMKLHFDEDMGKLTVVVAHLSLGPRDRRRQLEYVGRMAQDRGPVVVLGDLNSGERFLRHHHTLAARGLCPPQHPPPTYPSWNPRQCLDHVLVTPDVKVISVRALSQAVSDHCPLAVEIELKPRS
jgi:endonuclease/exonuclease/phosphatase family metal-dependent hydrolase